MCQAYEGEKNYLIASDLRQIRKIWEAHESGEHPLTAEEIYKLAVQKLMLEDR